MMVDNITLLAVLTLMLVPELNCFMYGSSPTRHVEVRSSSLSKRSKLDHSFRKTSLSSSSEFKSNGDDNRLIPNLNPSGGRIKEISKSVNVGSIQQGGYYCSFEMYACQKQTQRLVGSHLANWARAEIYCLKDCGTFSMILHSLCGKRVFHVIGWKIEGNILARNFADMRKRGEGPDGGPAALKESSHMYHPSLSTPQTGGALGGLTRFDTEETHQYPLFSIDLFNCQQSERHGELVKSLEKAVLSTFPSNSKSIKKDSTEIHKNIDGRENRESSQEERGEELSIRQETRTEGRTEDIPELQAMHLLQSTDKLCCILLGAWTDVHAYSQLSEIPKYAANIADAKKLSIQGSYSDIVEKTAPNRMYYVYDVLLPNSLDNPLLDYSKMF